MKSILTNIRKRINLIQCKLFGHMFFQVSDNGVKYLRCMRCDARLNLPIRNGRFGR